MERAVLNSIGLWTLSTIGTFFATRYWVLKAKRDKAQTDLTEKVGRLETQLALVGQTIMPLSTAFQAALIKQLTHFHTPEMDGLMRAVEKGEILSEAREARLLDLLKRRAVDVDYQIDSAERDAARMLPMVMRRVRADSALARNGSPQIKLVAVATEPEEESP